MNLKSLIRELGKANESKVGAIGKFNVQNDPNYILVLNKIYHHMFNTTKKNQSRSFTFDYDTLAILRIKLQTFSSRKRAYKFARKMVKLAERICNGKTRSPLDAFTLLVISKDLVQIFSDKRNKILESSGCDTYLRRNL